MFQDPVFVQKVRRADAELGIDANGLITSPYISGWKRAFVTSWTAKYLAGVDTLLNTILQPLSKALCSHS